MLFLVKFKIGLVGEDVFYLVSICAVGAHDQGDEVLGLGVDVAAVEVFELAMLVEVL